MLVTFSKTGLHLKVEKYEFHKREVKYLGLRVGKDGLKMDPDKVAAVKYWELLKYTFDVQSFLGLANIL